MSPELLLQARLEALQAAREDCERTGERGQAVLDRASKYENFLIGTRPPTPISAVVSRMKRRSGNRTSNQASNLDS